MSESQRLTPDELVSRLAEKARLSPDQVRALLQAQAELASEQARYDYPVPGIGMLQLIDTPPRTLVMKFGPKMGQTLQIPAKKKLKFRVCATMTDIVLGNPKALRDPIAMPDLFDPEVFDVTWYPPDAEHDD
ncbi:MAG TPA: HU family DNA-binding protein [Tepidisphaeraceae bacterium]|jgi:nucleoid DNA-binding protein|nr:HU family DNA-binding protein [Tepidisphaeraceae bacterium]